MYLVSMLLSVRPTDQAKTFLTSIDPEVVDDELELELRIKSHLEPDPVQTDPVD